MRASISGDWVNSGMFACCLHRAGCFRSGRSGRQIHRAGRFTGQADSLQAFESVNPSPKAELIIRFSSVSL